MAKTYRFTTPDGRTIRVAAPDDATREQAFEIASQQYDMTRQPPEGNQYYGPGHEAVGLGEAALSLGTGMAGQAVGGAAGLMTLGATGGDAQAAAETVNKVSGAMTYEPRSPAGQRTIEAFGNMFEPMNRLLEIAPDTVFDITQSPAAGAATAAIQEAALMGAGGALAKKMDGQRPKPQLERGTPEFVVQQAQDAGYVIPPFVEVAGQPVGSAGRRWAAGAGGKTAVEQSATRRNQVATNRLAAEELGLHASETITPAAIARIRNEANKSYDQIPKAVKSLEVDDMYINDMVNLAEAGNASFPASINRQVQDLVDRLMHSPTPSTQDALDTLKDLRARSRRNMNSTEPHNIELGEAQRTAAAALESLVGRNLEKAGHTELLAEFQAARQRLAKAHSVQDALGPDGNVDPTAILRQMRNGIPLSGNLLTIAETTAVFPKAMQPHSRVSGSPPMSILDFRMSMLSGSAGGALGASMGGGTGAALGVALTGIVPPATRAAMIRAALRNPGPLPPELMGEIRTAAGLGAIESTQDDQ